MGEDLVCKSSVDRAFLLSPIIASLITVEAAGVRASRRPQHTVRRAGTKILMHRNYPNYHVNGILRAPALCFRPLAAPCDSDLCTRLQPADRRVRARGCRHSSFRAETHTRAHMRPLHEFRGRTVARTLPTRIHESNCFIYE